MDRSDEKPSAAEIKRRQQEAEKAEGEVKLVLRRISKEAV